MSPARPLGNRRRPTIESSSRDLAMLKIAPIDAPRLPRAHITSRQGMGAFRVHDRPSGSEVLVYTPMFSSQFASGHRAGRWYVRPVTSVGGAPCSLAFGTAKEAIDAVGQDAWKLRVVGRDGWSETADRARSPRLRVIWNPPVMQD